jgi:hypothetical protein
MSILEWRMIPCTTARFSCSSISMVAMLTTECVKSETLHDFSFSVVRDSILYGDDLSLDRGPLNVVFDEYLGAYESLADSGASHQIS